MTSALWLKSEFVFRKEYLAQKSLSFPPLFQQNACVVGEENRCIIAELNFTRQSENTGSSAEEMIGQTQQRITGIAPSNPVFTQT